MQLKAIVFDYGGVLCFHPPEQKVVDLAAMCRLSREQFLEGYWSQRLDYDRGDLERDAYWQHIGRAGGHTYSTDEIEEFNRRDIQFWVHLDRRMMEWARQVREAGIPIGLLSNLPRPLGEYLRNEMRMPDNFDHHTFSYELRTAKPDAPIYEHAVNGLGIQPAEALFLDDRPANVEGARAAGLYAIEFQSPQRLKEQLDELTRETGCSMPVGTPPVILE